MPNTLSFFVSSIDTFSIERSFSSIASDGKLESDERLITTDVVCEGPIEGLVDKEGNLLKYITDSGSNSVESIILGKGVYYNNVPLIDGKLNKLNFVAQGFDIRYGEEISDCSKRQIHFARSCTRVLGASLSRTHEAGSHSEKTDS